MTEIKLKPCPFCGDDDLKIQQLSVRDELTGKPILDDYYYFVGCRNSDCFIVGPSSFCSMKNAVDMWNKRE